MPCAFETREALKRRIPKGFRPKAQGCEERATLGRNRGRDLTLKGLRHRVSACWSQPAPATTLSGLTHSRQPFPRVARSSQPWAGGRNPLGIDSRNLLAVLLLWLVLFSRAAPLKTPLVQAEFPGLSAGKTSAAPVA